MNKDIITRGIGVSYVLLGGYYFLGDASMSKQTIASLSISAFIFILSDAIQIYSEKYPNDSVIGTVCLTVTVFLNTLAIMFMLITPFLNLKFTENSYDILGTTLFLVGFGISIWLLAKRNEKRQDRQLESYKKEVIKIVEDSIKAIDIERKFIENSPNEKTRDQREKMLLNKDYQ